MNLRYRLFLSVGGLFFIAFILSFVLETTLTHTNLLKAEKIIRGKILNINEEKRKDIEEFLLSGILGRQAKVDAVLKEVIAHKNMWGSFSKEGEDVRGSAAAFLLFFKWIGFIQSSIDEQLTSLIVPDLTVQRDALRFPIDENLSWIVWKEDTTFSSPFLGVRIQVPSNSYQITAAQNYLLFSWESILKAPLDSDFFITHPTIDIFAFQTPEEHQIITEKIFESLKTAQAYLKEGSMRFGSSDLLPWIKDEIKQKENPHAPEIVSVPCTPLSNETLNERFLEDLQVMNQLALIWQLANFLTHEDPKKGACLLGITRFLDERMDGDGFLEKDIFIRERFFDDENYYRSHLPPSGCPNIAEGVALVATPKFDRLFVGNVLQVPEGKNGENSDNHAGYFTIGFDIDELLQELALVVHEMGIIVHKGQVITAYSEEGKEISVEGMPIFSMLSQESGIVSWKGKNYFFLHITPIKDIDMHFFVLEPEEQAFALVKSLDEGTQIVLSNIAFGMRLVSLGGLGIVLLVLHRLSRQITQPISVLARATTTLKEGHLEQIHLPEMPKRQDEISSLYTSFHKMIIGLQEKEKVKAVLNKVVSQEIAQEILKGSIHLGGEEREVTVLFADIRGFTKLTQKMAPHEVIDMLNGCMTVISRVIDEEGGVIDKYIGDAVMALFGAPVSKEESALKAVTCAVKIQDAIRAWNVQREQANLPPLAMGIGVHTGLVVAGNMGAENRLNYTVLGSNVNLASRLCDSAEPGEVLISKNTYEAPRVKEIIMAEPLAPIQVKGFDEPVGVYSVKGLKL